MQLGERDGLQVKMVSSYSLCFALSTTQLVVDGL